MAKSEGLQNFEDKKQKAFFYKPWTWFTKRWTAGEVARGSLAGGLGLILATAF